MRGGGGLEVAEPCNPRRQTRSWKQSIRSCRRSKKTCLGPRWHCNAQPKFGNGALPVTRTPTSTNTRSAHCSSRYSRRTSSSCTKLGTNSGRVRRPRFVRRASAPNESRNSMASRGNASWRFSDPPRTAQVKASVSSADDAASLNRTRNQLETSGVLDASENRFAVSSGVDPAVVGRAREKEDRHTSAPQDAAPTQARGLPAAFTQKSGEIHRSL